jgi:hypothetical protein
MTSTKGKSMVTTKRFQNIFRIFFQSLEYRFTIENHPQPKRGGAIGQKRRLTFMRLGRNTDKSVEIK